MRVSIFIYYHLSLRRHAAIFLLILLIGIIITTTIDGYDIAIMMPLYKKKYILNKHLRYNNIIKRYMRKAAGNTALTIAQKHDIAAYIYGFINGVIDKTNKKPEILPNVVEYFKDNSLGEHILKQSIAKGFFPKLTFFKKEVLPLVDNVSKISLQHINEKTDKKFLPEILLAAQFANAQQNIQGIIMNNEQPLATAVARTAYSGGNYVKDVMLQISSNPQTVIDIDIKIGNNAYNVPNGILGPCPLLPDGKKYSVLCDKTVYIAGINDKQLNIIKKFSNDTLLLLSHNLPLDVIQRNILIQDELLKMISTGILQKSPNFYVGYQVLRPDIEIAFFKKLEPFINANNFNSKKDFEILARQALRAYFESLIAADRSKIFNKDLFTQTGFDQINVEDLFSV